MTEGQRRAFAELLACVTGDAMLKAMTSTGEAAISAMVRAAVTDGFAISLLSPIAYKEADTIVFEYPLRGRRADAVVFHVDGSATVVEIKDGSAGVMNVLSGIGQCGLYACTLGQTGCSGMKIKRALLWTRISSPEEGVDADVAEICRQAGVTPIFMPRVADMLKERAASFAKLLAEAVAKGEVNGAA